VQSLDSLAQQQNLMALTAAESKEAQQQYQSLYDVRDSLAGSPDLDAEGSHLFDLIDSNKNGSLSQKEILSWIHSKEGSLLHMYFGGDLVSRTQKAKQVRAFCEEISHSSGTVRQSDGSWHVSREDFIATFKLRIVPSLQKQVPTWRCETGKPLSFLCSAYDLFGDQRRHLLVSTCDGATQIFDESGASVAFDVGHKVSAVSFGLFTVDRTDTPTIAFATPAGQILLFPGLDRTIGMVSAITLKNELAMNGGPAFAVIYGAD